MLVNVTRILKIAGNWSVVESSFSKVTGEMLAFYNSVENSIMCIGMFGKWAILEISKKSLSIRVVGLQSTGSNATENDLPTKFLEVFRKIWKISTNRSVIEFLLSKLQTCKLSLACFEILDFRDVCCRVSFYRNTTLSGSLQKSCSKQFFGNCQEGLQVYLKVLHHWYFTGKFIKAFGVAIFSIHEWMVLLWKTSFV